LISSSVNRTKLSCKRTICCKYQICDIKLQDVSIFS